MPRSGDRDGSGLSWPRRGRAEPRLQPFCETLGLVYRPYLYDSDLYSVPRHPIRPPPSFLNWPGQTGPVHRSNHSNISALRLLCFILDQDIHFNWKGNTGLICISNFTLTSSIVYLECGCVQIARLTFFLNWDHHNINPASSGKFTIFPSIYPIFWSILTLISWWCSHLNIQPVRAKNGPSWSTLPLTLNPCSLNSTLN